MAMKRMVAALTLLLASAVRADAQGFGIALQGGEISDETGAARAGATVTPELRWSEGTWSGRVGASGTLFTDGGTVGGVGADGDGALWSAGPLALVLGGFGSGAVSDAGYRAVTLGLSPGARMTAGPVALEGRALFRAAGEAHPAGRAWRGFLPLGGGPGEAEMSWRRARGAGVTVDANGGPVDARIGWSRMALDGEATWSDWTASAGVTLRVVEAAAEVGRRLGVGSGGWAAISVGVPVTPGAALTAAVGSTPSDPLTGRAAGRFATAGIRLDLPGGKGRHGAIAMPPPLSAGVVRLSLRAAPGSSVEVMGDWSGWRALPVPEVAPGEYAREVVLEPGVYRFAFRVDGRWTLPPEHPTEPDEYGGRRAVLRVAAPGEQDPE
ncbi:MAG TPA: glycogen-binding domain-containing protein [Longimicrobiaceae bacterium]